MPESSTSSRVARSEPESWRLGAGWPKWLHNLRLHASDIFVLVDQLLDDLLVVVRVECLLPGVSLEEVEDVSVVRVPADAVVETPGFQLRESRRLGVDSLQRVGMLGESINLTIARGGLRDGRGENTRVEETTYGAVHAEVIVGDRRYLEQKASCVNRHDFVSQRTVPKYSIVVAAGTLRVKFRNGDRIGKRGTSIVKFIASSLT